MWKEQHPGRKMKKGLSRGERKQNRELWPSKKDRDGRERGSSTGKDGLPHEEIWLQRTISFNMLPFPLSLTQEYLAFHCYYRDII